MVRAGHVRFLLSSLASMAFARAPAAAAAPALFAWERGIGLRIPGEPAADMYFWVYEWNMFGAMQAGQHTHGTYQHRRTISPATGEAAIDSPGLSLRVHVVSDG